MRKPLKPMPEAERIAWLEARGMDHECIPYSLTPAERSAARNPGLPAEKRTEMETPIVSGKAAVVAGFLATAFGAIASLAPTISFLPSWAGFALWLCAALASILAGLHLPEYKGGAVVAAKAVPALAAVAAGLGATGAALEPGSLPQGLVGFGMLVVLALTGKAVPLKSAEQANEKVG